MEEKKSIKISLSTFLLIITIIALGIMGVFLYKINYEKSKSTEQVSELNNQVKTLENSVSSLQKIIEETPNTNKTTTSTNETENKKEDEQSKNSISFSTLSGIYVGDVEEGINLDGATKVKLYLYENGSYDYENNPGLDSGSMGYYTFSDNELVLHEVLACGNDIGRTITSNTITLQINKDNSITDSKLNTTLKKSSQKIENKTDIISTELKRALSNNSLQ